MSDSEKQIIERNLVLIGAQRAGKSSLMAAWYEFLSQFPSLEMGEVSEAGVFDVARIKSIWKQIKEEHIPASPTEQGLVRANHVEFDYQGRSYAFNFIDLSGETATKAFTGELGDPEIEKEVISTCRNADQLYLVISLEDYAKQNRNQLADLLSFFDQVIRRPDFHTLLKHGFCVYLSHPEKLSDSDREQFLEEIRGRFKNARPNLSSDIFSVCSSVIEERPGEVRFSEGEDAHSPMRMFHHTFADLTAISHPDKVDQAFVLIGKLFSSKTGRLWFFGLTFLLVISVVGVSTWISNQKEEAWSQQELAFNQIKESSITEETVAKLRAELSRWDLKARQDFHERYQRDEYDLKVSELESKLTVAETDVRTPDDLEDELQEIVDTHKLNYRRLYPAIIKVANEAIANPRRWDTASMEVWGNVKTFIQALQQGVYLEIKRPSFVTNINEDFILEFHVYERGETDPWGKDATPSDKIDGIAFKEESQIKQKKGQYRLAWSDTGRSRVLFRPETDQMVVRFMEETLFGYEEAFKVSVSPHGVHGLAWFDKEHKDKSNDSEGWFRYNFKDYSLLDSNEETLKIPDVLEEAYP